MSDQDQDRPAKPSHIAYQVREADEGKAYFNRVGSAFLHKDGKGFNVELDAVPVNGRVVLRSPQDRLDSKRSGEEREDREDRKDRRSSRDRYER